LALVVTVSADAAELCVKCTGPDASYACIVGANANATMDTVAKLYCITALAKSGPHASCSIDRTAAPPCRGERKELPVPSIFDGSGDDGQPQETNAAPKGGPAQGPPEAKAPQSPPSGKQTDAGVPPAQPQGEPANEPPPKTVQEMVEKSAKSAGSGLSETQKSAGEAAKSASTALEKAGSAVGGAAKSSWKCLSSFFSNC
jgi:hypothetical protein